MHGRPRAWEICMPRALASSRTLFVRPGGIVAQRRGATLGPHKIWAIFTPREDRVSRRISFSQWNGIVVQLMAAMCGPRSPWAIFMPREAPESRRTYLKRPNGIVERPWTGIRGLHGD